ncbi:MAG: hypothetical protein HPY82_18540 [Gammaproteobacteria bacterium]|nr:hypothetical protein [Gammaproteobacteria bacterium]
MAEFYIDKLPQSTGEHRVHFSSCKLLPTIQEKIYLGSIASFASAWSDGKRLYNQVDACPECAAQYVVTH